jgi:hypothetical protein
MKTQNQQIIAFTIQTISAALVVIYREASDYRALADTATARIVRLKGRYFLVRAFLCEGFVRRGAFKIVCFTVAQQGYSPVVTFPLIYLEK